MADEPFLGAGNGELLAKHIYEGPPSLLEFAPTASPPLAEFIHRLLQKDRQVRPAMEQVLRELEEMAPSITQVSKVAPAIDITTPPASAEVMTPVSPASSGTQLAGQSSRVDPAQARKARKLLLAAAGIVVGALGLAVLARQGLKPHADVSGQKQARPANPPPAASLPGTPTPSPINVATPLSTPVHWQIKSIPSGATVVRIRDGRVVGQTPWQAEQPAETGSEQILLRLHGHADKLLTLDLSADAQREERLNPAKQPTGNKRGRRVGKSPGANKKAAHDSVELEE